MNKNIRVEQVFNPHDWNRSNASQICSSVSSPGHVPAITSKKCFSRRLRPAFADALPRLFEFHPLSSDVRPMMRAIASSTVSAGCTRGSPAVVHSSTSGLVMIHFTFSGIILRRSFRRKSFSCLDAGRFKLGNLPRRYRVSRLRGLQG